jgi:hypothetical protein
LLHLCLSVPKPRDHLWFPRSSLSEGSNPLMGERGQQTGYRFCDSTAAPNLVIKRQKSIATECE